MRDLARLRDRLYAVVLATPLLASCSGGPPRTTSAPVHEPWPLNGASCQDGGTWCGSFYEAEPHAAGTETTLQCAVHLSDEYLKFSLDVDRTQERRELGDLETCCYRWRGCPSSGREPQPGGRPYGAPAIAGESVAERWLAAAQTEHASVASFARASLELLAVGAPPALIAGCHRAALDELRHAAACLAIGSRHAGRAVALAPVPGLAPRGGGIVRVAVDTYLEGCVAETFGALVAQRALDDCGDPEATRALRRIARDEARHAELAWQIVAWALETGGAPVRAAMAAASRGLVPPPTTRAADARLARSGQLDDAALDVAARDAWREIIAPLTVRLLAA